VLTESGNYKCSICGKEFAKSHQIAGHISGAHGRANVGRARLACTKEELYKFYWGDELSALAIAKKFGVSASTVKRQISDFNIPQRSHAIANKLAAQTGRRNYQGENHPQWKGGRISNGRGYILVRKPNHPKAIYKGKYIFEHLLIWESVHQKPLPEGYVIHHLNGNKSDNRPENLVALPTRKHHHILAAKGKRIRELEAKVKLLEKALDSQQLIFRVEEN